MISSISQSLKESLFIRIGAYALLGVLLLISPNQVINFTIIVISLYFLVSGITQLYAAYKLKKKLNVTSIDLFLGLFQLVLAAILFFFSKNILAFFPVVIGLLLILDGIFQLFSAISNKVGLGMVYSLLLIVIGFVLLFNPFGALLTLTKFLGFWLLVMAVFEIFLYLRMDRA